MNADPKQGHQDGTGLWPLYLSAPAAVAFWLLALSPFWLAGFFASGLPESAVLVFAIMQCMTLGLWGGSWVLSYYLRHHGPSCLCNKKSLARAGAALGACAVITEILVLPFRPDPLGYASLGYYFLPPLIPLAGAIGSLYGLLLSRIVVIASKSRRQNR